MELLIESVPNDESASAITIDEAETLMRRSH